ncbi:tetratricopeptide repeat protein, partial [Aquisphaera insulae]|uniref:tetratricopeptide repeat protein n=1 Tax=Aquisphaera insulae TaxID=2712864 RepID=UPI0013ECCE79
NNGFWTGFGTGALTAFGMGALGTVVASPVYSAGFGVYDYFPTWGVSNYSSWGIGSVASNWLYSGYANPYNAAVVAAQPAQQTTIVYDYSQPINVAAAASQPAPATAEAAAVAETAASTEEQLFSTARDAFKAGDYAKALSLADQVIKAEPNMPAVHEFRALCLFALKRYDEAAAVVYAVLSAGPGWSWATLVGLYPDVDTYTNQVRALEAVVKANPTAPATNFLLAYHYMTQGHQEAAAAEFQKVTTLQPDDKLSASFVKALKKVAEQPAEAPAPAAAATNVAANAAAPAGQPAANANPPAEAEAPAAEDEPPPPPPPANLVGTWKAKPNADLGITLTLKADGEFSWEVDNKGQKQTLTGRAGFKDGTLALLQPEGPPLVGKVTEKDAGTFLFAPPSGSNQPGAGLTFSKS